jgi:SAM-dependent methyltransferase
VTPLYGFHLPIVIAICVPLRLDTPIAYLAANVSLPFIAPFLSLAEIELGAWMRTGHGLALDAATLRTHGVAAFASELALGTLLFSPMMAIAGFALTFAVATGLRRRQQEPSDAMDAAIGRVAGRYARGRRAAYHYVRSKLSSDPVARAIAAKAPLGKVVDVGCGRGQLGVLLLEAGSADAVTGFDWDEAKVRDARSAAEAMPVDFAVGDVRSRELAPCDTLLLIDVLHYLTIDEQDALLLRAAEAVRAARGRILVRDLDPDRGWRSKVTRVQEAITTSLRFNRGARVQLRPMREIQRVLEGAGFAVTIEPCWGSTPFANVLLVGTLAKA